MNFAKQKKRLDPLLKHPNNHTCADCNALAPTCIHPSSKGLLLISESFSVPAVPEHIGHWGPPSPASNQPILTFGKKGGTEIW